LHHWHGLIHFFPENQSVLVCLKYHWPCCPKLTIDMSKGIAMISLLDFHNFWQ
jgi:hypothetical protein